MGTFLGTGIAYLGKEEIWVRVDRCPHCGARGQLAHYTAGKYLKLAGISLFSLGRVRIEDDCRLCRRFRLVAYAEWQSRREKVMESFGELNEAGEALVFLEAVLQYSSLSDLQEQAPGLTERFGENPRILALLGNAYSHFREWEQAEAFFEAAEDSLELQCLRALDWLRRGYPAEAASRLEPIFQDQLQAYRDSLYLLAEGYQSRAQMDAAQKVLERIVATWPSQAVEPEHKWYVARNRGRKPLPTLALKSSIPAVAFVAQPMVYGTLLPLLICYVGITLWSGLNRQLYLVNGTDAPYDIEIGGRRRTLVPGRPEVMTTAEGRLDYKISDPSVPSGNVTIQTFWATRAFQKWTFVLNPDGLAVLHTERNGYSKRPIEGLDAQFQLHPPQRLHQIADVDLAFEEFPTSITVSEGHLGFLFNDVTYIRRMDVLSGTPTTLLAVLAERDQGLSYLESALRVVPSQGLLDCAEEKMKADELLDAANRHLETMPVETAWHILYQDLSWSKRDLQAEYRERLSKSPKDPELQFLLARVSGDGKWLTDKPFSQFEVLHEAKMALSNGDFARAEELSRSRTPALRAIYAYSLLAQRRYQEVLALPLDDSLRLLTLLAAGQEAEASHCVKAAAPSRQPTLELELAYAQGSQKLEFAETPMLADLFAGKWQEVQPQVQESQSWTLHLSLFLMSRDKQELARAIDILRGYPPFTAEYQAAQLLAQPDRRALALAMRFDDKRLVLAALCLLDPKHRESYRTLAEKLNFEKSFPYWTIKKVLE